LANEKEEITHLCFSNDLMIFHKAEVALIFLVRNSLNQFWVASGLSPNLDNRVICSYVVLLLIQKCSFTVFSSIRKENCRLGILVFLLLLQSFMFMIAQFLWTESWLKLGLGGTAIFLMQVDFNFSIPSSSLFKYIGLVSLFFLRLLWRK